MEGGKPPSAGGAPGAEEVPTLVGQGGEPEAVQTTASVLGSDPEPEPEQREPGEPEPEQWEPEPEEARGVAYQVTRTLATVACCICGAPIAANPLSMCAPCIATNGNVAESLPSRCELQSCRTCGRYLLPRKVWAVADWESRELMAVCLKKLKGLSRLKLVDAQFIWTEPHSKRVKVKLTVQDDVYSGTVLEQQCVVEYVIINVQRAESKDTWQAVVQLRQKVPHRRTFLYLEQLILTHKADKEALNVKEVKDGMDFFFASKQAGAKFSAFLASVVPTATKESGRVVGISHHVGTSTTSFSVTVAPICKNDLVYLPKKVRRSLGGIGPLVLCVRVASALSFLCLTTLEVKELAAAAFFKQPFKPVQSEARLVEYTVLDIEPTSPRGAGGDYQDQKKGGKSDVTAGKRVNGAMIEVVLSADFGVNDNTHTAFSQLGHILQPGDLVMGYDLGSANVSMDDELTEEQMANLPSVVLVKKKYRVGKHRRARQRRWKLRQLAVEEPDAAPTKAVERARAQEREAFYQELEEDTEVRKQVTLYSTERQRRQTEQRAAAAAAAVSVSAASATTPEKDDDIADDDDDDADAVLVPDGELLEYDSEVETEDEDEDEDTATQGLNAVLDGVSLPARPTPVGDEDL